jgi:UDP-N-acetylmuramoylalanine--D-glutamate ligase
MQMRLTGDMKAVVVGLGKSGMAAVRYLHNQGLEVKVSESQDLGQISGDELAVLEQCGVEFETGGHTEDFVTDADLILVSPGVPADLPVLAVARGRAIPILGEFALAADRIRMPVIAVTGSNGKTTVTSLIGHLLRAAGKKVFVGGNIGTPVLEYLLDPGDIEVMVMEVSSFQLESAGTFRPDIGLLLNLSPDHLDRHGSMEAYAEAKRMLFAHQVKTDIAIIGADDPLVMAEPLNTAATILRFGASSGCRAIVCEQSVQLEPGFGAQGEKEVYELTASRLCSRVNRYNVAAAVLAARSFGCSREGIKSGLLNYQPPEHRMTPVGEIRGVFFINDSKATNVGAVVAALAGFKKDVVLIAGGRDKGSDFSALRPAVGEHVKHLILIGESATDFALELDETTEVEMADNMDKAVSQAFAAAGKGDTVLLAPACASFDMFDNYGQRGRVFTRCVQELRNRIGER